jgi:pimeloyl-ACP methyl ester carboxylesterase
VTVAYVATGPETGTPVLLLHAWGESRQSFDRLVPLLPDRVRAIALDQRGHGDAGKPASGYSLEEAAADVVAFLDAIGEPAAILVGSSSGGYVAQQVAVSRPDRVAGLVLVGSPRTLQQRPPFADEIEHLTDPVDTEWVREALTWFPLHRAVPRWYLDDRVRDGARVPARVWRATFEGLVAATPPTDQGTITAPTLILGGEHDDLLGHDLEALAAAIPDARSVVYEETGHLVLWEEPERVAADLADFLATVIRPDPASGPPSA